MEELVKQIREEIAVLNENLDKNLAGNKAAGTRARKSSLNLTSLLKTYRKVSVEESKK